MHFNIIISMIFLLSSSHVLANDDSKFLDNLSSGLNVLWEADNGGEWVDLYEKNNERLVSNIKQATKLDWKRLFEIDSNTYGKKFNEIASAFTFFRSDAPVNLALWRCETSILLMNLYLDSKSKVFSIVVNDCPWHRTFKYKNPSAKESALALAAQSMWATHSERAKKNTNNKCEIALKSGNEIYQRCAGIVPVTKLLTDNRVLLEINSFNIKDKVNVVRNMFYAACEENDPIPFIAFGVDLYHSLPAGNGPPPSDITPTNFDKGLLHRFDEPLGYRFGGACNLEKDKHLYKGLKKFYIDEKHLDGYRKPARFKSVTFPSPNENQLRSYLMMKGFIE